MIRTTSDLLDSIKRRSFAPDGQATFSDAELLAMADEETQTTLLPDILSIREEYFVTYMDFDIIANLAAYDIPVRSIGLQARDVQIVRGSAVIDLPRIEPESVNSTLTGTPEAFFLKGNSVWLFPTPAVSADTLRVPFPLRPSKLIDVSEAAVISAINGTVVTVSSIPVAWVTGDTFDLIRFDGGQECRSIELQATLVSGNDISFSALPDGLRVGDYVALAGESPLVQLPPEWRAVLAQAVATVVLEDTNQSGADRARKKLEKMRAAAMKLLTPRTPGEARVIAPNTWGI